VDALPGASSLLYGFTDKQDEGTPWPQVEKLIAGISYFMTTMKLHGEAISFALEQSVGK
jgi:hypothetical protein